MLTQDWPLETETVEGEEGTSSLSRLFKLFAFDAIFATDPAIPERRPRYTEPEQQREKRGNSGITQYLEPEETAKKEVPPHSNANLKALAQHLRPTYRLHSEVFSHQSPSVVVYPNNGEEEEERPNNEDVEVEGRTYMQHQQTYRGSGIPLKIANESENKMVQGLETAKKRNANLKALAQHFSHNNSYISESEVFPPRQHPAVYPNNREEEERRPNDDVEVEGPCYSNANLKVNNYYLI